MALNKSELKENKYYVLIDKYTKIEKLVYFYHNISPNPENEDKLGFGFNEKDGRWFTALEDLSEDVLIYEVEIKIKLNKL